MLFMSIIKINHPESFIIIVISLFLGTIYLFNRIYNIDCKLNSHENKIPSYHSIDYGNLLEYGWLSETENRTSDSRSHDK